MRQLKIIRDNNMDNNFPNFLGRPIDLELLFLPELLLYVHETFSNEIPDSRVHINPVVAMKLFAIYI